MRTITRITALLTATMILGGLTNVAAAQAGSSGMSRPGSTEQRVADAAATQPQPRLGRWRGACSTWLYGENLTPVEYRADPARGRRMMIRLIRCEFDRWAPGNADTAVYVADRESSLYPWSQNVTSNCSGLFQHVLSAWPSRAAAYLDRWEYADWLPAWSDARANTEVAAKMVAAGGWGPWSL